MKGRRGRVFSFVGCLCFGVGEDGAPVRGQNVFWCGTESIPEGDRMYSVVLRIFFLGVGRSGLWRRQCEGCGLGVRG